MCRDHQHGARRCRCCDPEARRAARREARMRERGHRGEIDAEFAAATVAERAALADEHAEAAFDPSPTVRTAAARGPLTEETEAALAGDEKSRVRRALASNPACSPEVLDLLSRDEDAKVREAVAPHPSTPPETLRTMAEDLDRRRDLAIARALAKNPRTPRSALEEWIRGGTEGQRTLARAALRKRAEQAVEGAAGAMLDGADHLGEGLDGARTVTADEMDDALGLRAG
ncbi:hypothetical protein EDL96_07100 [Kocuria soli]|uniref:HEAT repeat domain-containing protein n=1 Tax=Kocuria soli TaxID=2485125 RepID=A0A3N3ZXE0_9MICC|nr:hypothetical protein [Kocuria soli]ROZ63297.1 hypothetical protein EDL96_07100 [Kocuria soli]